MSVLALLAAVTISAAPAISDGVAPSGYDLAERAAGSAGVAALGYAGCFGAGVWGTPLLGATSGGTKLLVFASCAALVAPLASSFVLNEVGAGEAHRAPLWATWAASVVLRLAPPLLAVAIAQVADVSDDSLYLLITGAAAASLISGGVLESHLLSGDVPPGSTRNNPFALWATLGASAIRDSGGAIEAAATLAAGAEWAFAARRLLVGPRFEFMLPLGPGVPRHDSLNAFTLGARFHLLADHEQPTPFVGASAGGGVDIACPGGFACRPALAGVFGAEAGLRFPVDERSGLLIRLAAQAMVPRSPATDSLAASLTAGLEL